jgi:hypothetical protein
VGQLRGIDIQREEAVPAIDAVHPAYQPDLLLRHYSPLEQHVVIEQGVRYVSVLPDCIGCLLDAQYGKR